MTTKPYPDIISETVDELFRWVREVTRTRLEDIGDADAVKKDIESIEITDTTIVLSDVTTNNVSSSKHGFAPKSPADATKFLNGAATPDYALVKDSDLSTSDITTNNASTSKHGFLKKLSNVSTEFMNGEGNWAAPAESQARGYVTISTTTPTLARGTNCSVAYDGSGHSYTVTFSATISTSSPIILIDCGDTSGGSITKPRITARSDSAFTVAFKNTANGAAQSPTYFDFMVL